MYLQVPVDVAEHVHRRLDEEAPRFVLEDGTRPRAEPQHVPRELDRGQVRGVLLGRLEHPDDPLGHLVVLPARLQAAQGRRSRHAGRPPHVPPGAPGTLLVHQVDHRLQRVLALGHAGVRGELVAQPLDLELMVVVVAIRWCLGRTV